MLLGPLNPKPHETDAIFEQSGKSCPGAAALSICMRGSVPMEPSTVKENHGNFVLRRKANTFTAMIMLYLLGSGLVFMLCTRTFVSFHMLTSSLASHLAPAHLPGESLDQGYENPVLQLRDVRSVADDEPPVYAEFMQEPVLRIMNSADTAEALQARMKNMTRWERRRWLADNWSSFHILKDDAISRRFRGRMQRFFCSGDETEPKCRPRVCRHRFILTWMSPVSLFGPRERLCLESIFKWHPDACVVILSRTMDKPPGRKVLRPFVARGYRVTAVTPDLGALFAGLPVAAWWKRLRDGTGDPGTINLMQNLSNAMRLAALWKYGGVYLDTDVVILRPLDGVRNAVGAQNQDPATGQWTRLNNAVLVFDRHHPLVLELLREFADTFDGSRWGWNGPYLVSRVVENAQHWDNCSSLNVLPLQAFYPVNWVEIVDLFHRPRNASQSHLQARELEWIQRGSYAIHLWNKKSNFLKVEEGSIMETLFKQSCLFCKTTPTSRASVRERNTPRSGYSKARSMPFISRTRI